MARKYQVSFEPEAEQAIFDRADYIAEQSGSRTVADRYVEGIYTFCRSLSAFPRRNIKRDDLRPGLHITNYLGTAVIAYEVEEDTKTVHILAVFHSSQSYENLLKTDSA